MMLVVVVQITAAQELPNRRVAVTFDDLPIAGSVAKDEVTQRVMTLSLLRALSQLEIPAIGFVNERQLFQDGVINERKVDLLRLWLAAGMTLGNHSFSHPDLNDTPLDEFQVDVLRGEVVTRRLLEERDESLAFFRHPFLHTGTSVEKKEAFEAFLAERGYRVAPVTIDNSEWIFARAYDLAMQAGNPALAQEVGREYVDYMMAMFAFYEDQSHQLFGRNIDHVLLVHANELNSAWFAALAERLVVEGYTFISLPDALKDPAYRSPDTYVGRGGITWLHRWAITRQVDPAMFRGEPETPAHILQLTELQEHSYETGTEE